MNSLLRRMPLVLFAGAWLGLASAHAADGHYHFIKEIPIGGGGGWDYLTADAPAHRLYVSHGTSVVVIDTAADQVAGRIEGTPGVHGLAVAADLHRGFTTNGRENKVGIVDLTTLRTLAKVDTGLNPDAMLYVPARGEIYAFNGRSESATVIDAAAGRVTATIPLGGKPEFAVFDAASGRIFNNLEDQGQLAVIDPHLPAVIARWPIAPGEEASGLALDEGHHRLFLGCRNGKMLMMDATDGRVVTTVPIGRGVDANAFDPGTQLAFASCGDGTVTIAREDNPEQLTVVQTLRTEPGARTMALDPSTHRIYLATARFEPVAATAGRPQARPTMAPDSFKVLVYGPD